jgi:hypothetical protein
MKKTRKRHTAEFKTEVAIEAIKGAVRVIIIHRLATKTPGYSPSSYFF